MLALFALLACPKPSTPALYPTPIPELDDPAPLVYDRAPDTCSTGPVLTGEPVPFVDAERRATCGGILVADDEYAHLLHDADVALPWYRSYARICVDGRSRDRLWGQSAYDHQAGNVDALQRENRALRVAVPVAFGAGVLAGGAFAVVATRVQVEVLSR